ncbi:sulfotransferase domain-containing protein [Actibacterium ureilyticum]|uniref:sulfotransferase domain-containing protein n=1 Tax=Actibacterium ureilyticum TaxID=1590614 RepID=UPI000BAB0D7C|nr:sulfotransferase domain-containing protein [Actibacterium ureilyticum]
MVRVKPEVIGIGAQKCASSWIHAILGAHPDVGVSDPKEVDFFSYYFDRGYKWYEGHFSAFADKAVRFESSPSYFYDPRSPERAVAYHPGMKVLALLRNPVERAYSNHLHEVVKGHIPACPFEEGVQNNPTYLEQGRYGTHLSRWFDAFPRDQIKVMFAEDISNDPAAAAADVFRFIGVDSDFVSGVFSERRNESDRAKHPALRSTLRAGGDWLRRQGLEEPLMKVKASPPVAALLKYNKVEVRDEIPKMRPETRAELVDRFAPEMATLRALLPDQPLPWDDWGRA